MRKKKSEMAILTSYTYRNVHSMLWWLWWTVDSKRDWSEAIFNVFFIETKIIKKFRML